MCASWHTDRYIGPPRVRGAFPMILNLPTNSTKISGFAKRGTHQDVIFIAFVAGLYSNLQF